MISLTKLFAVLTLLLLSVVTPRHSYGIDLFGGTGNNNVQGQLGDLISIDLNNNAAGTKIGSPTAGQTAISGLAFDNSGTLFASTAASFVGTPSSLLTINPTNGNQLTSVSITFLNNPLKIADLADSPLTDLLYGISSNLGNPSGTNNSLFTINKSTGIATLIGTPGIGTDGAIAFRADGTLWEVAHVGFSGQLVELNPLTGMPISSPVDLNNFYNAFTILQDGRFIGAPGNDDTGSIWQINPNTPNMDTFLGNSNISVVGDLASRFASVPDSGSTLVLLGVSLLVLITLTRIQKHAGV